MSWKRPLKEQNLSHLKGEIAFRKKLARQHVTGEMLLPDYYAKETHDRILRDRVNATIRDIRGLGRPGGLSPFLELGAERCQRSLVLTNDFGARGFAVDISFDQLKTAAHFADVFDRPKLPLRVCCDANRLPFRTGSFPLIFCYAFLHHFPSPAPVVREARRVMSEGVFFFKEEPFKRPKIVLYKQRQGAGPTSALRNSKAVRFLEKFISDEHGDERGHGIIENDAISLKTWIRALSVFERRQVTVSSVEGRVRTRLGDRVAMRNLPNMLLGGEIEGVCGKEDLGAGQEPRELTDLMVCPDCVRGPNTSPAGPPALRKKPGGFACRACGSTFPVIDDIIMLLPSKLFRELYPELAGR